MLLWITIAAVFFSKVYIGLGAGMLITELVEDSNLSPIPGYCSDAGNVLYPGHVPG